MFNKLFYGMYYSKFINPCCNLDNIKLILERNNSYDNYTKNAENAKNEITQISKINTNKYNDVFNLDVNHTRERIRFKNEKWEG